MQHDDTSNSAPIIPFSLEGIDGRTKEARRFKTIVADLTAQLGREPTPSERGLLVSAAVLQTLIERDTLAVLGGEQVEAE